MRISSFLLSFLLHLTVLAVALLWPDSAPPGDLTRPVYQVSLVMGDPGGENLASAVLGPRPQTAAEPGSPVALAAPPIPEARQTAPELAAPSVDAGPPPQAAPVPQPSSIPAALPAEQPVSVPQQPLPTRQNAPQPALPSRLVEITKAERPERKKKPDPPPERPKPEAPRQEPLPPRDEPKQEEPKKQPKPAPSKKTASPNGSAAAHALADLRKQSGGSAASRALADLEKQGGGGGMGDGPGGGGLYDVYVGQVMLLVQSYWSLPTYSRENLVVQVRIVQDASGRIQDCRIVRSSGRNDVDASAVNAVLRAKQLPPPPTPAQQELIITFNTQDMGGR